MGLVSRIQLGKGNLKQFPVAPRSSHSAISSRTVLHNHLRLRWSFMGKYRGHNYSREFSREVQFLLWQGEVTEWSNGQHVHWGPGVQETWGTDQLAPPVDWSVIWPRNVQNTVASPSLKPAPPTFLVRWPYPFCHLLGGSLVPSSPELHPPPLLWLCLLARISLR